MHGSTTKRSYAARLLVRGKSCHPAVRCSSPAQDVHSLVKYEHPVLLSKKEAYVKRKGLAKLNADTPGGASEHDHSSSALKVEVINSITAPRETTNGAARTLSRCRDAALCGCLRDRAPVVRPAPPCGLLGGRQRSVPDRNSSCFPLHRHVRRASMDTVCVHRAIDTPGGQSPATKLRQAPTGRAGQDFPASEPRPSAPLSALVRHTASGTLPGRTVSRTGCASERSAKPKARSLR